MGGGPRDQVPTWGDTFLFHLPFPTELTDEEWTGGSNSVNRSFIMCWELRGQG